VDSAFANGGKSGEGNTAGKLNTAGKINTAGPQVGGAEANNNDNKLGGGIVSGDSNNGDSNSNGVQVSALCIRLLFSVSLMSDKLLTTHNSQLIYFTCTQTHKTVGEAREGHGGHDESNEGAATKRARLVPGSFAHEDERAPRRHRSNDDDNDDDNDDRVESDDKGQGARFGTQPHNPTLLHAGRAAPPGMVLMSSYLHLCFAIFPSCSQSGRSH
jgi:hypothetical protein